MYLKNRNSTEYLSSLKLFMKAAEADKLNNIKPAICCPGVDCKNVSKFASSMDVMLILSSGGFMGDYNCWNMHDEAYGSR
jgi:hypothetical protein